MKQLIHTKIRSFLQAIIVRLGYRQDIFKVENTLLDNFFLILQHMDFRPTHIVDVGANHGTWTRAALKYFPDAQYTLFEPQQWLETHVSDLLATNKKVKFYPLGVGKTNGALKFTLLDRDDSSTFSISEKQAQEMGCKQIDVEVIALNEFIKDRKLPIPDIIKIDAEGFDLEVLDGASNYFGKTEIFMIEAAVMSKYIKNDIATVLAYMKNNGYKLFDITDLNRPFSPQILWLVELVFIRENGWIDSKKLVKAY